MLHAAVVPVDRPPVFHCFGADKLCIVVRVHIAQEVPRRTRPLRHGVRLALRGAAAARAFRVDPLGMARQRAFAALARLKIGDVRQAQRQLAFGQGLPAAGLAVYHRNRLAPVALTAEHPVAQLEIRLTVPLAVRFQPGEHLLFRVLHGKSIEEPGIDKRTGGAVGERLFCHVAAADYLNDGQIEHLRKFIVARIVRRHGHNRARAVAGKHIIGNKDGDMRIIDGVYSLDARKAHACFLLVQLGALKIGFARGGVLIGAHLVRVCQDAFLQPRPHQRVFGAKHHIGCAEQRVAAGGVHRDGVACSGGEIHLRAIRTTDPVLLLSGDALDIVQPVQVVDQAVGVGGDLQHPLAFRLVDHRAAAALAHAVHDFLVCQYDFATRAVVDVHFLFVRKALFVKLEENPLCPLVIVGVGRVDLARPVERKAKAFHLAFEARNVFLRHLFGMDMVLHRKIFGGQAERVPAHRVQHIVPLQTLFAHNGVQRRITARVADVQARAGGVRELYQGIKFWFGEILRRGKRLFHVPDILPFFFNRTVVIFHNYASSNSIATSSPSAHRWSRS